MATDDVAAKAIGERLRLFLELRGLSVSAFAAETKIPNRTLRNYLSGRSQPGADHLARMAGTGIDITWLLTDKVRAGFETIFENYGLEGAEAAVAADARLYERAVREAFAAADGYHARRLAGGGAPLTSRQTALVVSSYLRIILMWASKNLDMIKKSGGAVKDDETLKQVFTAPVGQEFDNNIDSILSTLPVDAEW